MSDPFVPDIIKIITTAPGVPGGSADAATLASMQARLTALEAIVTPPTKAIVAGRLYGPIDSSVGWSALTTFGVGAGLLNAGAFVWPADAPIASARLKIVTAGVAGTTMRLGIYAFGSNGLPTTKVMDLGVADVTATGDRSTPPVGLVLPRGTYWLAGAANNPVSIQAINTFGQAGMSSFLGHGDTSGTTAYSAVTRSGALAGGFTTLPFTFGVSFINTATPAFWVVAG